MRGSFWKDRAILREQGGFLQAEWYVRFGRRQLLTDWLHEHTHEQITEMYATTATHEGIPLRILDLFPIVEPQKIRAARVLWVEDIQEADLEILRSTLDIRARDHGLQIEPETVRLETAALPVRRQDGKQEWRFSMTALAR